MVNIKRKVALNLLWMIVFIFALSPILVIGQSMLVIDDGNLFTEEEIIALNQEASAISNSYKMDIVILTTTDANGKTSMDFADDYFDVKLIILLFLKVSGFTGFFILYFDLVLKKNPVDAKSPAIEEIIPSIAVKVFFSFIDSSWLYWSEGIPLCK